MKQVDSPHFLSWLLDHWTGYVKIWCISIILWSFFSYSWNWRIFGGKFSKTWDNFEILVVSFLDFSNFCIFFPIFRFFSFFGFSAKKFFFGRRNPSWINFYVAVERALTRNLVFSQKPNNRCCRHFLTMFAFLKMKIQILFTQKIAKRSKHSPKTTTFREIC